LFSAFEAWKNIYRLFLSGPASMTRNQFLASPTKRPRAWSAVAALLLSLMLAPTATFADAQAPATPATQAAAAPAPADHAAPAVTPAATDPAQAVDTTAEDAPEVLEADNSLGMAHDLSPWGMYQNADIIVKIVMIGLAIASIITWTSRNVSPSASSAWLPPAVAT